MTVPFCESVLIGELAFRDDSATVKQLNLYDVRNGGSLLNSRLVLAQPVSGTGAVCRRGQTRDSNTAVPLVADVESDQ